MVIMSSLNLRLGVEGQRMTLVEPLKFRRKTVINASFFHLFRHILSAKASAAGYKKHYEDLKQSKTHGLIHAFVEQKS